MDTQFRKFAGRFIRYWRQLPIALLAVTVFALGFHAKLSLYEPASPVVAGDDEAPMSQLRPRATTRKRPMTNWSKRSEMHRKSAKNPKMIERSMIAI